jgi:hypothetical protein
MLLGCEGTLQGMVYREYLLLKQEIKFIIINDLFPSYIESSKKESMLSLNLINQMVINN